ncbi:hypothetical protein HNY73_003622 [Argiope bruennichi]|uniref:Uncharacterized protein n=1 Tax=Argiope bruennichi TaxID=94029 RepID=A0A8T0FL84_ARGBR|nr:hypothetical protein HNY73_003622 [Argiope bruennichi]
MYVILEPEVSPLSILRAGTLLQVHLWRGAPFTSGITRQGGAWEAGLPIMLSSCIPIAAAPGRNIARPLKHIWGERNGARFTSSWICRGLAAWQAITHRPDKETLGPHFNDPPFFDLSHFETKAPPPLLQR